MNMEMVKMIVNHQRETHMGLKITGRAKKARMTDVEQKLDENSDMIPIGAELEMLKWDDEITVQGAEEWKVAIDGSTLENQMMMRYIEEEKDDINLKMMHVINRVAVIMFLFALVLWIIKRF